MSYGCLDAILEVAVELADVDAPVDLDDGKVVVITAPEQEFVGRFGVVVEVVRTG